MTNSSIPLFCANHPTIETSLRCNNCEKPICPKCAVLTPTGYRCRECVRSQQKVFDTAVWYDYPIAGIIAAALSYFGSFVVPFVSFFIIFLAPIFGMLIAEAVRAAIRKRRSRSLYLTAAAGAALGALPGLFSLILGLIYGGGFVFLSLLWYSIYALTITSTVYYRLRGINIR